jgi:hypothetical protein
MLPLLKYWEQLESLVTRFEQTQRVNPSEWSVYVRFGAHLGLKSDIVALPKSADIVAKVENRTTLEISPKSIFGLLCCCVAFQRRYGGP